MVARFRGVMTNEPRGNTSNWEPSKAVSRIYRVAQCNSEGEVEV